MEQLKPPRQAPGDLRGVRTPSVCMSCPVHSQQLLLIGGLCHWAAVQL